MMDETRQIIEQAPDISVILFNYNKKTMLMDCLESLYSCRHEVSFDTIVVNKRCGDGTEEILSTKYPEVLLLDFDYPFELARYRTEGMKIARGRYVAHFDIDMFFNKTTLTEVVRFMDRTPNAGCCGGKLFGLDGMLQYSCRQFFGIKVLLLRKNPIVKLFPCLRESVDRDLLMTDWDHNDTRPVDWVGGGFMVISRDAMMRIGFLDKNFIYGMEDIDYCIRVWKTGLKVYYVHTATITHIGNRPSTKFGWFLFQIYFSTIRLLLKHGLYNRKVGS